VTQTGQPTSSRARRRSPLKLVLIVVGALILFACSTAIAALLLRSPAPADHPTYNAAVREGVFVLSGGIREWSAAHDDRFPPVEEVGRSGGVGKLIDKWPANPYTREPVKPGPDPGDYTYTVSADGLNYRLSGHLGDGTDFTIP